MDEFSTLRKLMVEQQLVAMGINDKIDRGPLRSPGRCGWLGGGLIRFGLLLYSLSAPSPFPPNSSR